MYGAESGWCGCCKGTLYEATNNAQQPMIKDIHMYVRSDRENSWNPSMWCDSSKCQDCHPTGDRCAVCREGFTQVLGACYDFMMN